MTDLDGELAYDAYDLAEAQDYAQHQDQVAGLKALAALLAGDPGPVNAWLLRAQGYRT